VDVFHGNLESVEAPCFWELNFCAELLSEIFKYNSITSSEESQDVLNEVFFIVVEFLPVLKVLVQVDFFSSPKTGHLLLVHHPDIIILDGKPTMKQSLVQNKSIWVLPEDRFIRIFSLVHLQFQSGL
jgi:hypothetical protein